MASTSINSTAPITRRSRCDDERYVAARAIQLFAKGVPQVYYVGLLGWQERRRGSRADRRRQGDQPARLYGRGDRGRAPPPGCGAGRRPRPAPEHPSRLRRRDVRRGDDRRSLANAVAIPERRADARRRLRRRTSGRGGRCGTNADRQLATLTAPYGGDRTQRLRDARAAGYREAGRSDVSRGISGRRLAASRGPDPDRQGTFVYGPPSGSSK